MDHMDIKAVDLLGARVYYARSTETSMPWCLRIPVSALPGSDVWASFASKRSFWPVLDGIFCGTRSKTLENVVFR